MSKSPSTVRLSDEQRKALKAVADKEDRSVNYITRKAVDEYLEKRALLDIAIKERLEAIKNSNEPLISHEDVGAWIESLGSDNELNIPC